MERLFLTVLHRGMAASYFILAVIFARFLLKKAPKSMICMLWAVAGLRLICPFPIETAFSLVPEQTNPFASRIYEKEPLMQEGRTPLRSSEPQTGIRPEESGKAAEENAELASRVITAAAWVWMAGIALMAIYLAFSWYRVSRYVAAAIPAEADGIRFYQCDRISSPFLFGLAAPKIYVPFSVSGQELSYVLKHEQAHKRRCDHLSKIAGYLFLTVYWFQPLVWAAYLLLCRDIELACDERVVTEIGEDEKKAYSQALLSCSSAHRSAAVCPVAFGGIGVKKRVKNILNYKKPGRLAVLAAAAVCLAVTVCFATEAKSRGIPQTEPETGAKPETGIEPETRTEQETGTEPETGAEGTQAVHEAETETMLVSGRKNLAAVEKCVVKWAEAFCGRDAKTIYAMLDDTGRKQLSDADMLDGEHSFGWSSPWPWDAGVIDDQPNYRILSVDDCSARILYYAWTSDPHVTVWYQAITYQYTAKKEGLVIHDTAFEVMDSIHSAEQFFIAYPNGEIDGTRMDYYRGNGAGEALNRYALLSDNARLLRQPDTAAVFLLNIQDDPSVVKTDVTEQGGETVVTFTFLEDGSTASVKMIQMLGEYDIWVPQSGQI